MDQVGNSRNPFFDSLTELFPTGTASLDVAQDYSSPVAESAPTINSKAVEHAPAADVAASAISTAPDLVGQPLNAADALASTAVIVAPIQNGDHVIPTPSSDADPYHGADFGLTDQSFDLTSPSNENDSEALVARGSDAVAIASGATPASHLLSINEAFGANSSTANSEIIPAPVGTFFSLASAAPSSESIFFAPAATPHPGTPGSVWMTGDLGTLSTSSAGIGGSSASGGSFVQGGSAGSGLIINVNWDASVANAPVGFQAGVESAVNYFESHFSNPITITLDVGYGEVNGQAMGAGALGESEFYLNSVSYSTLRSALVNNANAIGDSAAAASLPTNSPVNGYYWLTTAEVPSLGTVRRERRQRLYWPEQQLFILLQRQQRCAERSVRFLWHRRPRNFGSDGPLDV